MQTLLNDVCIFDARILKITIKNNER